MQIPLRFAPDAVRTQTHVNLSAVCADGRWLWIAGDETATVERLAGDGGRYGEHVSFRLADAVELPGGPEDEVDIEGLARSGPYLWAVGSHGLVRKKVKSEHADAKSIRRLAQVEDQASRRVLTRLAVVGDPDGRPTVVPEDPTGNTSAVLGGPAGSGIAELLADDEHLGRFLAIPSKDNGLDVEGLAVQRDRLYLGLRGPVLRGWAVVVEIRPRPAERPDRLRLGRIDADGRYRKHFLDLGGLGVRDLCPHGDDLLVLAGPTMDLDGPVRVYRWHEAVTRDSAEMVRGGEISMLFEVPHGQGDDHAEGITLLDGTPPRLLVVYDSPASWRLPETGTVLADAVPLR